MSEITRTALGLLSVAAIGYLFAHAANAGTPLEGIAYVIGLIAGTLGFGMLAWGFLRPAAAGERQAKQASPRPRGSFLA